MRLHHTCLILCLLGAVWAQEPAIRAVIVTGQPMPLVVLGHEAEAFLELHLRDGNTAHQADLSIEAETYDGQRQTHLLGGVKLAADQPARVPLAGVLHTFGWYRLHLTLTPDLPTAAVLPPLMLAYIEPAGRRAERSTTDRFHYGLDIRARTADDIWQYAIAELIGADMIRQTTSWGRLEPTRGDYLWELHDPLIAAINAHGMIAQYNYQFPPDWAVVDQERVATVRAGLTPQQTRPTSRFAPDPEAWRTYIRATLARFREQNLGVDLFEIWNEPDLAGFYSGTTDDYLELLRIASEEVHAGLPGARVMTGGIATLGGHGGHGLNPDLIERVIRSGTYDVLNLHEHGTFDRFVDMIDGELPRFLDPARPRPPLCFNETGTPAAGWGGVGQTGYHEQAQQLVKKVAFSQHRGAIGFNWFVFRMEAQQWTMVLGERREPLPTIPAYNTMVRMLRGLMPTEAWNIADGYWALAFSGNGQTTCVGWDERGLASGVTVPVRLPADATPSMVDLMGNRTALPVHDGVALWTLTQAVTYLEARGQIQTGPAIARIDALPTGQPGATATVPVTVANPLDRAIVIDLRWRLGAGAEQALSQALDPTASTTVHLPIALPATDAAASALLVRWSVADTPWSGELVATLPRVTVLPQALDETRPPDVRIATANHVVNRNENDPTRLAYTWQGPQDLAMDVWLAADQDALSLRVVVTDNQHHQTFVAPELWKGDSVQIGLVIPGLRGHWELGAAKRSDTNQLSTACWKTPEGLDRNYHRTITKRIERSGTQTIYELRLPFTGLGTTREQLHGHHLGFNIIANDDDGDGQGRKGYVFAAPGLGGGSPDTSAWLRLVVE